MKRAHINPPKQKLALLCMLLLTFGLANVHATMDEAHDYTMEAAKPYVEQGYTVREDYWNGEVESGQKLSIKHQLFKGNEYAFWLGTGNPDCELDVAVYDDKNNPVHMERKEGKNSCSVRVNPPKTGTYTVVFFVKSKKERGVTWALAYGYR